MLVVLVDGRFPVIDAGNQAAAELLAGTAAADATAHRGLSERSGAIMRRFAAGEPEPLRAVSRNPSGDEAELRRIGRDAEQRIGTFRHAAILGTVPAWWSGEPTPVTFVRLDFEHGSRLFRLHREEDHLVGFGGSVIPNPARTTLFPQAEHTFVGYNLGIERHVPVRFEVSADGVAEAVRVGETEQGVRVADGR